MLGQRAIRVFCSYSHKDEKLRKQLETHLTSLRRQRLIEDWYDHQIGAGQHFDVEIDKHLEAASIILLLVSADFLQSDYCYSKEMTRALELDRQGRARVIPIILRPVVWRDAPFSNLLVLPADGRPITKWSNRDEAWVSVTTGIRNAIAQIKASTQTNDSVVTGRSDRLSDATTQPSLPELTKAPGLSHTPVEVPVSVAQNPSPVVGTISGLVRMPLTALFPKRPISALIPPTPQLLHLLAQKQEPEDFVGQATIEDETIVHEHQPIPAQTAARLLGYPKRQRTFVRRAQEALDKGDPRVYKVNRNYFAPLSFWREIELRPAGRPPKHVQPPPPLEPRRTLEHR